MNQLAIQPGRVIADNEADRQAWLAERRNGIGASESAAVLGLSRWESPLEVYLRKKELMPPKEETPEMRRGKRLESVIAAEYADATGADFALVQYFVRHPERRWQFATLDAMTSAGVVVEFKSVGWRSAHEWGEEGTDAIPRHYLVQVLHQLAVTGAQTAHVAALIGGAEFRVYTVERDEELIREITLRERDFMRRLQDDDPPPAIVPADAGLMQYLYPEPSGFVCLGSDGSRAASNYRELGRTIKALEDERDLAKARLLEAMGDAETAEMADGTMVKRKVVSVKEAQVTRKAYSFVDLRFKAPKETP